MKKIGFGAIFMALVVGGIIVLAGCKKEKNDVLSGTTWSRLKVDNMLYPTQSTLDLVFDNDGNMSIGNLFTNIPYTVDNNVMSLSFPSGDTYQHRFIIDDDEQMLKILDNFHYYSLTADIWDTVYFKKVN